MNYRRTILFTVLIASSAVTLKAQNLRINGFGGYTFRDKFDVGGSYNGFSYSGGAINESAHFGGGLEFVLRKTKSIELFYQNQPTTGYLSYGFGQQNTDVSVNYLMIGGLGYAPFSPVVSGYGGLNIGAAWASSDLGNSTKFAWGGKLGLMINASESIGIKLGAQLLSPVQGAGGGLYFGTGGASAGVSTYSTIYQFGFTGGLCFTLNGSGASPRSTR
jgi:hypothetical protein